MTSGNPGHEAARAAEQLELRKRVRMVEEAILARAPEHDLQPSLDRIEAVVDLLGDPQRTFSSVHITGTNGKTSTTRMIDALIREHGLRTGRFTSPHLHDIRERIVIDGEPITREAFLAAYEDVMPFIDMVDAKSLADDGPLMTYFEVIVALAYAAFADAPVEVGVVEVGMGGAWDATNVIDAQVSVLTPIGLDHQHFLGTSVEDIATEKSGIIKPGAIAVSALQEDAVFEILQERAEEVGARLVVEGRDIGVLSHELAVGGQLVSLRGLTGDYNDLFLPLHGRHQAQNALLALVAAEALIGGGESALDLEVVRAAFASFSSPGRLEIVRRSPTVLVDSAHNPHGAAVLRTAMEESFTFTKLVGVVAVFKDKDADGILAALEPVLDEIVVTRTTSARAMDPDKLGEIATEIYGEHRVHVVRDLPDALDMAANIADADGGVGGGVLATGSVYTAAEVRMLLGKVDV